MTNHQGTRGRGPYWLGAAFLALLASHPIAMASSADRALLMIPGPIEFSEEVLQAAGGGAVSHVSTVFINQFGEALELLRKVFLTQSGQPFVISGSGTLGWDMVAANLVEPGEDVLVLNTGYFGDRFAESLEAFGAKVTHVRAPAIGARPSLADIEAALAAAPAGGFKVVTVTHVDTSTGVLMDVEAISKLVAQKAPGALFVVDGVCSAGGEELQMDAWGVDVVLTASQKALGTPPGLSIMMVSQRAMGVFNTRKAPIQGYYVSWKKWLPIMRAYEERRPAYFATPAVQLVQALRVSLQQILADTPDMQDRFRKHREMSKYIKDTVESWGLRLVPTSREGAATTMTAVYLPDGVDLPDFMPRVLKAGVQIAGGLLPQIRYFRIGHMGISVTEPKRGHLQTVLKAVHTALEQAGHKLPKAEL